jgi:MspA
MLNRFATLAAVCMLIPAVTAPLALADPPPAPPVQPAGDVAAPGDPALGPSAPPGVLDTPDGWHLEVIGRDEHQEAVAPLTTALSSREYVVGGTFSAKVSGSGKTKLTGGSLEAGYQIGCGIAGGPVELTGGVSLSPSIAIPLVSSDPAFGPGISGQIKIGLKPGVVNIVPVDKKSFKGMAPRVTITGFRIKIDGCVGQSFLRSYATLTSSTDNTDDVITYLGVTKVV